MERIERIHSSLDKLLDKGAYRSIDIATDKWILVSDHHRGIGDGADDFAACESTYLAALQYYYEQGFGLILLGDAEEFWENTLKSVITRYDKVLKAEQQFHDAGRMLKIWGNHDDAWNHLKKVQKYLFPFFRGIETHEAINITLKNDESILGKILLVHGHQGSGASDQFASISKWFVRVFWRNFQRLFKVPLSTPSKSKTLKDKHDIAMHTWAKSKPKQLLICGHTHQPVFMSKNHLDILHKQKEEILLSNDKEDHQKLQRILDRIKTLEEKTTAIGTLVANDKPCYFNTGCCSYADGDITGIEIANGTISLVKWNQDNRMCISSESLTSVYEML